MSCFLSFQINPNRYMRKVWKLLELAKSPKPGFAILQRNKQKNATFRAFEAFISTQTAIYVRFESFWSLPNHPNLVNTCFLCFLFFPRTLSSQRLVCLRDPWTKKTKKTHNVFTRFRDFTHQQKQKTMCLQRFGLFRFSNEAKLYRRNVWKLLSLAKSPKPVYM